MLEEALNYVPKDRWKLFCNEYLEPINREEAQKAADSFKRLEWIRQALIRIVRLHSGADEPDTATRMRSYYDW